MTKFITITFWISNQPFLKSTLILIATIFALVFAIGLLSRNKSLKKKGDPMNDIYKRISIMTFTMSILGFSLLWFSSEGVLYLGMRFNYVIWGIGLVLWIIPLYKRYKKIPAQVLDKQKQEEYQKYLPKKK